MLRKNGDKTGPTDVQKSLYWIAGYCIFEPSLENKGLTTENYRSLIFNQSSDCISRMMTPAPVITLVLLLSCIRIRATPIDQYSAPPLCISAGYCHRPRPPAPGFCFTDVKGREERSRPDPKPPLVPIPLPPSEPPGMLQSPPEQPFLLMRTFHPRHSGWTGWCHRA